MQRREFIGVEAPSAVSLIQSDLRATYRCRCTSHRPRKWDSSPFAARRDGPRIRFGLERVIRYAAFCSSTPPAKLVRGSPMVAMPATVR
jgi:hypothetical protein